MKFTVSNDHISGTGRPIDFVFNPTVGFSGTADRMDLLPVRPNPRGGRPPSLKISNDHISGMGYPVHFHELESSVGGIYDKIMRCLLSAASEPHRLPAYACMSSHKTKTTGHIITKLGRRIVHDICWPHILSEVKRSSVKVGVSLHSSECQSVLYSYTSKPSVERSAVLTDVVIVEN